MKIRRIDKKDNAALEHLIRRSLEAVGLDIPGTAYYDPGLANLSACYAQEEHGDYWVLTEQGHVIGGIGIAPFPQPQTCELQKLYIHRNYQGQGLANRLMDTALTYAAKYYRECYLETHSQLRAAQGLYEKYGFRQLPAPLPGSPHSAMDRWYLKVLQSGTK